MNRGPVPSKVHIGLVRSRGLEGPSAKVVQTLDFWAAHRRSLYRGFALMHLQDSECGTETLSAAAGGDGTGRLTLYLAASETTCARRSSKNGSAATISPPICFCSIVA